MGPASYIFSRFGSFYSKTVVQNRTRFCLRVQPDLVYTGKAAILIRNGPAVHSGPDFRFFRLSFEFCSFYSKTVVQNRTRFCLRVQPDLVYARKAAILIRDGPAVHSGPDFRFFRLSFEFCSFYSKTVVQNRTRFSLRVQPNLVYARKAAILIRDGPAVHSGPDFRFFRLSVEFCSFYSKTVVQNRTRFCVRVQPDLVYARKAAILIQNGPRVHNGPDFRFFRLSFEFCSFYSKTVVQNRTRFCLRVQPDLVYARKAAILIQNGPRVHNGPDFRFFRLSVEFCSFYSKTVVRNRTRFCLRLQPDLVYARKAAILMRNGPAVHSGPDFRFFRLSVEFCSFYSKTVVQNRTRFCLRVQPDLVYARKAAILIRDGPAIVDRISGFFDFLSSSGS